MELLIVGGAALFGIVASYIAGTRL